MSLLLVSALFLPLFPFSSILNWLLAGIPNPVARFLLLLAWPQIGIGMLSLEPQPVPYGFALWALATSVFYAIKLLTIRDLGLWGGFLACSALALTWGIAGHGSTIEMQIFAFGFSLPAALLQLLTGPLAERFGAAFAGLYGGIADSLPRLSGVLVFAVLAAIATPPAPGFFALLGLLNNIDWPLALGVLFTWLLWTWAATRLLQGFISGSARMEAVGDIGRTTTVLYAGLIGAFVVTGLVLTRGMP